MNCSLLVPSLNWVKRKVLKCLNHSKIFQVYFTSKLNGFVRTYVLSTLFLSHPDTFGREALAHLAADYKVWLDSIATIIYSIYID